MAQLILRPARRRRRPFLLLCIASPVILCLGWTALWLFAESEAARLMDGWIAQEAARGRQWSCPDRTIGGFPLELRLTCKGASYHGPLDRDVADMIVAGVTATISLFQPRAVEVAFASPFTLTKADANQAERLTWSTMIMRGRLLPDGRGRVEVQTDEPSLQSDGQTYAASHVEVHVTPAMGTALQDHAYEVWLKLDAGILPPVDALTGESAPVSVDEKGVLRGVDPPGMAPWPVLVEAWRQAGGVFDLTALNIVKGAFRADAKGRLGLDATHRLSGRLEAALSGYETVAERFGVPPRALAMGNVLSKLLSHGKAATEGADAPAIKLPLAFADGKIMIGPLVTPQRLSPLY